MTNHLQLHTLQEQSNPKPTYTQAELPDLLEVVISYQGKKKIQLGNVVFVYQRF